MSHTSVVLEIHVSSVCSFVPMTDLVVASCPTQDTK